MTAKHLCKICHSSSDIAKTDDPPRHAAEFMEYIGKMGKDRIIDIFLCLYIVVIVPQLLHQIKEHCKGMLCNRFRGIACYISPCNPTLCQILFVQVIRSGCSQAD